MSEVEEILATIRSEDGKSIKVLDYIYSHKTDGVDYVKVKYDDETRNLMVHYEVFSEEESPYGEEVNDVPYLVIKGKVYPISQFKSLGMRGIE